MTRAGPAVAVLLAAACGDVRETTYADFGAARRAGAVAIDRASGECFYWSRSR